MFLKLTLNGKGQPVLIRMGKIECATGYHDEKWFSRLYGTTIYKGEYSVDVEETIDEIERLINKTTLTIGVV